MIGGVDAKRALQEALERDEDEETLKEIRCALDEFS